MKSDTHAPYALGIIGGVAIVVAVWFFRSPVEAYELSIYRAVPFAWGALSIALAVVVLLTIVHPRPKIGGVIAVCTTVLISGAPRIRGYFFYASSDAYLQLAKARDILTQQINPRLEFYPGTHSLAAILSRVTGASVEQALLLSVPIFALVFVGFVSLATRRLARDRGGITGALLGTLFLPIMTFQLPVLEPIPNTFAILFLAVPLYLIVRLLLHRGRIVPLIITLTVSFIGLVFFHPQIAFAFVMVVVMMGIARTVLRSLGRATSLSARSSTTILGVGLGLIVWLWISPKTTFSGTLLKLIGWFSTGPDIGGSVASRANGLQAVGGSVLDIFLRVFLIKFLIGLVALGVFLSSMVALFHKRASKAQSVVVLLTAGSIPVLGLIAMYVAIGVHNRYLRYMGFLLVGVTIFAALGIAQIRSRSAIWRIGMAFALIIVVIAAVPAFHQSPYIYKGSSQVPQSEFAGYEFLLTHNGNLPVGSTKSPVRRYIPAVSDDQARQRTISSPDELLANFSNVRVEPYFAPYHWNRVLPSESVNKTSYIIVTDRAWEQDIVLYDGRRYTREEYAELGQDPGVDKTVATGGFRSYLISPS